jgi:transcriptional regulator with XRE-family HTH domain
MAAADVGCGRYVWDLVSPRVIGGAMAAPRELDPASSVLAFFGAELRRLRTQAGVSQEDLAQQIAYSASLVGMIETARRAPARDFAERCDAALDTGGALARLWPLVSQEALPRWFRPFAEIEREATSLRTWEPLIVPGLLQTEDYARALITGWQPGDGADTVEQQVSARMERQHLLDRASPPLIWAIIGEAALRNQVGGPPVLHDQLTRLLDTEAAHPRLIIQVIPFAAGAHPGLEGPLVLITRRDDPDIAYLEVQGRGHVVDRADDVTRYGLLYDMLRAVALPPDASREMIAHCAKEVSP